MDTPNIHLYSAWSPVEVKLEAMSPGGRWSDGGLRDMVEVLSGTMGPHGWRQLLGFYIEKVEYI